MEVAEYRRWQKRWRNPPRAPSEMVMLVGKRFVIRGWQDRGYEVTVVRAGTSYPGFATLDEARDFCANWPMQKPPGQ